MYISDYAFAGAPTLWQDLSAYYDNTIENWMYMGLDEWTMTSDSSTEYNALIINQNGGIESGDVTAYLAVRPVMYLKSSVKALSGDETKNSPHLIEY